MDRRLVDVSQAGNIEAFQALLDDEPNILDYIDDVSFTKTPLHIAILAQKPEFAKKIALLNPSFITKIDGYGFTPIDLAAKNGDLDMVRSLLEMLDTRSIDVVRGKGNKTPLHYAVMSGNIEVVKYLVDAYPGCVFDLTDQSETALHLAVKNKQMGVFVYLLEWLKLPVCAVCSSVLDKRHEVIIEVGGVDDLVNWKDEEGNTVLHLATMTKQHQMIEALLCSSSNQYGGLDIAVNSLNTQKLTALDIFSQFPAEKREAKIHDMFHKARALTAKQMISTPSSLALNHHIYPISCNNKAARNLYLGIDVVFAIIMVIICLLSTPNIKFYPFLVFNMLGFFLSFSILVAATVISPLRKALVLALVVVLGSYVYLMFSAIPSNDRALFGGVLLSIGAVVAKVHGKMEWCARKERCMKEMKIPMVRSIDEGNHSGQDYSNKS